MTRTIDNLLFRAGGSAAVTTDEKGFIFDNIELSSSIPGAVVVPPVVVEENTSGSQGSRSRRNNSNSPTTLTVNQPLPTLPTLNFTVSATTFTFVRDISLGSEGSDVTELQNRLTREGVYFGPITGYFGPLTFEGVKAYQRKMGIIDTGYVESLTRAELNKNDRSVQIEALKLQLIELIRQLIVKLQTELDAK